MNNDKIISRLNDLLTKSYDAEKGYKQAADQVKSNRLKSIFERRAQQRYDFGHELKNEIRNLGGTPDKGTSIAGDLHRGWINIKSALSFDTEESVLEECSRGEQNAINEYNEVLKESNLPVRLRAVLENQRNSIQMALNEVETLEEKH